MKLKDLEADILLMENSIRQAEYLNKEVIDMEHQVEHVRHDLEEELHHMTENFERSAERHRLHR
ncbi:hypothetical protein SCOR_08240 [Sulfidibacter corallicola]|uniref:Uncharacterized protein n=1 Tax=Sulfidibacter corallicola TaxID=2818388 RepID=A0A8A4TQN7_SULCO|nr:hypothetical protein [Sulfidibacter corallicola]QTD51251.1 hypothetical protein J3U87_02180 [Sulfidibacter corallicola]